MFLKGEGWVPGVLPTYPTLAENICHVLVAPFRSLGHFPFVLASALGMQRFMLQMFSWHFLLVDGVFSHAMFNFH